MNGWQKIVLTTLALLALLWLRKAQAAVVPGEPPQARQFQEFG